MHSAGKTVALGLVIGITGTALLLMAAYFSMSAANASSMSPVPTATDITPTMMPPSATPSLPPTFTPIPTFTLQPPPTLDVTATPTNTPDPVQSMLDSGGLAFSGPLSNAEQILLYSSSLSYVQSDPRESLRMSEEMNGAGYGDPSNICGPLAAAILRDAGLMIPDITPHDFWLLNPDAATDQALLRRAFPSDQYTHSKNITPLNKMDWRSAPLEPGDFIFIWHGSWGNFDHMLVVNRVDSQQRAYAVTNYGTEQGYVIAETLLYDPNDPAAGIFHTWTRERDAILGSTGFGGFDLWRRRTP